MERFNKYGRFRIYFVLLIASIFNFYDLAKEGYANTYYSAGVKSMLTSWKSFFYASFDSGNFVTIDKPPLGLWIQTIFAKIFGFSGWSVLVPQALAGVLSVYLIYYLIKKSFGENTGLLAGLVLAVTPMFVATSRNNTIDNLLIVTLLLATVYIFKAIEKGSLKYLLISVFIVGLGFNIKMLQAYMVLPAIYGLYFLGNKISLKKRIIHLVIATLLLITVSLSWATIVDLTPAEDRPYIGSSENNTVYELIFGHNGISRFTKGGVSFGSNGTNGIVTKDLANSNQMAPGNRQNITSGRGMNKGNSNAIVPDDRNMPVSGDSNMAMPSNGLSATRTSVGRQSETGNASILRLFNSQLSGQVSWMLVFALISMMFLGIKARFNFILNSKVKQHLFFWSVWAIPMIIYFSYTNGIFHRYYVSMLAPALAALTAIGVVTMWESFKNGEKIGICFPIAIGMNGVIQCIFLNYYGDFDGWLIPIVLLGSLSATWILLVHQLKAYTLKEGLIKWIVIIGVGIQLLSPIYWSSTLLIYEGSSLPYAGPELITDNTKGEQSDDASINKLIDYLESNYNGEKFFVAVPSANSYGSELILNTNYPIMAMGGFSGGDNILDEASVQELIDNGDVRYFLISNDTKNGSTAVNSYIMKNGTLVDSSLWQGDSTTDMNDRNSGNLQLYDMKN